MNQFFEGVVRFLENWTLAEFSTYFWFWIYSSPIWLSCRAVLPLLWGALINDENYFDAERHVSFEYATPFDDENEDIICVEQEPRHGGLFIGLVRLMAFLYYGAFAIWLLLAIGIPLVAGGVL